MLLLKIRSFIQVHISSIVWWILWYPYSKDPGFIVSYHVRQAATLAHDMGAPLGEVLLEFHTEFIDRCKIVHGGPSAEDEPSETLH